MIIKLILNNMINFLLPSIYKPFYMNVLFVQRRNTTFRTIIDVYNGIGIFNTDSKKYDIGTITVEIESNFHNDSIESIEKRTTTQTNINKGIPFNFNININRDKPLFMTNYRESITTLYYEYSMQNLLFFPKSVIIKYNEPENDYNETTLNRAIKFEIDVTNSYSAEDGKEPFYLTGHTEGGKYYISSVDQDDEFIRCVKEGKDKKGGFLYYVVNDAFYKYFIAPESSGSTGGSDYKTYNDNEIPAITGITDTASETKRITYDLHPHKVSYNGDDGGERWVPSDTSYSGSENYCKTTPFFRMYPSINSEPSYKKAPFAIRVILIGGETLYLTNMITGYPTDGTEAKFHLIAVKSPLTELIKEEGSYLDGSGNTVNTTKYEVELLKGSVLRPEQDYMTYIKYIKQLKIK